MTIELQHETTGRDEAHAGIRRKRIRIDEGRSDNAMRMWLFKPKNAPRRHGQREKTIGSVSATDRRDGPQKKVRPRGVSAELNGEPENARRSDKSQEGQARQFTIDTDSS